MNPFRNILRLSAGDFLAKTLNFVTFVYLARVLGVSTYGTVEFAIALLGYFLLLGDGGLELWATREAARGIDTRKLASRVLPLRLLLAAASFCGLLALLPMLPDFPGLRTVLVVFGLTLFAQAASLKWIFMGRENLGRVTAGLLAVQAVFAAGVFGLVRGPDDLVWVAVFRVAGELTATTYFQWFFAVSHGGLPGSPTLRGAGEILRPALTMGAWLALGLLSFSFDSILLGILLGPTAVGWYGAAYKPVTVALAMPLTYFLGLFPALSRTFTESEQAFRDLVGRSMRITSVIAMSMGVGGSFLAEPIIRLLFGEAYLEAVPALRVLSWSIVLVILRGTYSHALIAAGKQSLDLRCGLIGAAISVSLNLLLIPIYGFVGAALATVVADLIWLAMARHYFIRHVAPVDLLPFLWQPAVSAIAMSASLVLTQSLFWPVQAGIAVIVYFSAVILLAGGTEVRSWVQFRNVQVS